MGEFRIFICDVCQTKASSDSHSEATQMMEWAVLEHGGLVENRQTYRRLLCPSCYKAADTALQHKRVK